ncbi:MAG: nonstructural protein [Microvirus sp.]|nr:MAG: nonstructural protein [Microvirus sp.]
MSKLVAVAVFDVAAQYFHPPVFFRATGAALRWFETLVKDPTAVDVHNHPEHFQLFHIGEFDDFNALFVPLTPPNLLIHGSAFDTTPL